jgi:hypothetical protein
VGCNAPRTASGHRLSAALLWLEIAVAGGEPRAQCPLTGCMMHLLLMLTGLLPHNRTPMPPACSCIVLLVRKIREVWRGVACTLSLSPSQRPQQWRLEQQHQHCQLVTPRAQRPSRVTQSPPLSSARAEGLTHKAKLTHTNSTAGGHPLPPTHTTSHSTALSRHGTTPGPVPPTKPLRAARHTTSRNCCSRQQPHSDGAAAARGGAAQPRPRCWDTLTDGGGAHRKPTPGPAA